jgi:activator of HSP90 ATPase
MRWRFRSWPDGHYSNVTLTFNQKEDCTEMTLLQTGVPKNDLENTEQGWNRYYWQSINQTFGFSANLF